MLRLIEISLEMGSEMKRLTSYFLQHSDCMSSGVCRLLVLLSVSVANSEGPDKTAQKEQSDLGPYCCSVC